MTRFVKFLAFIVTSSQLLASVRIGKRKGGRL